MMQQTSIMSYYDLEPLDVRAAYKEILGALKLCGPLTDRELALVMEATDPNKVRPRRNELVKIGLVESDGRRKCQITGRTSLVWRVN